MPTIATPIDERLIDDDVVVRPTYHPSRYYSRERPAIALAGRILLGAIFLISGIAKFVNPEETVAYMQAAGIPYADTLRMIAGAAEILGAVSLIVGFHARTGAAGLILFLIPTTIFFHGFWMMEGAEAKMQMVQFLKNLCIMGGLAMIAAMGPGRYSVDVARGHRAIA